MRINGCVVRKMLASNFPVCFYLSVIIDLYLIVVKGHDQN